MSFAFQTIKVCKLIPKRYTCSKGIWNCPQAISLVNKEAILFFYSLYFLSSFISSSFSSSVLQPIWRPLPQNPSMQAVTSVTSDSAIIWTIAHPGSSVHGILQTRILEWVAMPSSRGFSKPRDRTQVSYVSCIGRWVLYYLGSPQHPSHKSKAQGSLPKDAQMSTLNQNTQERMPWIQQETEAEDAERTAVWLNV